MLEGFKGISCLPSESRVSSVIPETPEIRAVEEHVVSELSTVINFKAAFP